MPRASEPAQVRLAGRSILYIDDDRHLLDLTVRALDHAGARCRSAATHEEALRALAEEENLGAAIVDFEMPDGDAADLVEQLRSLRPDVILVGTSGRDHRGDFAGCGVDRYLPKPWRLEDLLDAIGW